MFYRCKIVTLLGVAVSTIGVRANYQPASAEDGVLPGWILPRNEYGDNDLAQRLSNKSKIYFPGSEGFNASQRRWNAFEAPEITIAVEVACQNDVVETVKWANERHLPYLAVNSGHGSLVSIGKMKRGVQIWTRNFKSVLIAEDGQTATFGPGVRAKDVTDALWAVGKQTVTGGCECVGILGPGLGGGHGFLQGRHGLIGDQFVSFDMVMADGSLLTVDRDHELWWAMRGAGHNFGIVTSFTSKIYSVERPNWAHKSFVFKQEKLEEFYTALNENLLKNGTQDIEIIHGSIFISDPAFDPENPVIETFILQEGVDAVDEKYTAPFAALGPVAILEDGGDYRDIPKWTQNTLDGILCAKKPGIANGLFPLDLQTYDIPGTRNTFNLFASTIKETPALNRSLFLLEGYSLQGVQAIPAEDSAYPYRESNLLVAPLIQWEEGQELDEKATKFGNDLRDILHQASGRKDKRTYVNYSFGDEGSENWYGHEKWRQEKLKALKKKYDPEGKFSFYAPIA